MSLHRTKIFVYKNARNKVAAYMVDVPREDRNYLHSFDLKDNNKYKLFKKSRVLKYLNSFEEAERDAEELQKQFEIILPGQRKRIRRKGKFEVCFTGFSAKDKKRLSEIAEQENMIVRSGVTTNLGLLICGENAGPKKIQKAKDENIPKVFAEEGFINFIETGEVSED